MSLRACIPKDKHDVLALERARELGFPALNPVLPDLLEWVQDLNWPVAQPTASLLAGAGHEIVPHLQQILAGNDADWKYWILNAVIAHLKQDVLLALQGDITRLATEPGPEDLAEEVNIAAKEILAARLSE